VITRFAPSPTGPLHLGHAYSAILAHDRARHDGGTFLLRIEDIDQARSRPKWEEKIFEDLHWLGLDWPRPVLRQSERLPAYAAALDHLWERGLLYPCSCSRRDIRAAASAPQEGATPAMGPDGLIYPGTCRPDAPPQGPRPADVTLRLNIRRALELVDRELVFRETGVIFDHPCEVMVRAKDLLEDVGDVVLARRDMQSSYHLSVVVDDAHQQVTEVVRGADLFEATMIHVLLQTLLALPVPEYHHHRLIRDDAGKRLAKRDDARAIAAFRADDAAPEDIRRMVGLA
jgi:glutamyl-Q tRNA(Asp) synthetase